jgi:SAM-dependent methyltransferase
VKSKRLDQTGLFQAVYPEQDIRWLEGDFIPQSMQFMIDMLPHLRQLFSDWPRGRQMDVLDVGTGTGAGANLLGALYRGNFFGFPMAVQGLEMLELYAQYARVNFNNVKYNVGTLPEWGQGRSWDTVICSHTIEHFEDPAPFMSMLQSVTRRWVVFYAPYNEPVPRFHGHLTSITDQAIDRLKPIYKAIVSTPALGLPCVFFVLPGHAQGRGGRKADWLCELLRARLRRKSA